MAKAYWVSSYRSISNPEAVAAYAKLAGPALAAAGGKFLARGVAAQAYEAGIKERIVVIDVRKRCGRGCGARQPGLSGRAESVQQCRLDARFPHRRGRGVAARPHVLCRTSRYLQDDHSVRSRASGNPEHPHCQSKLL